MDTEVDYRLFLYLGNFTMTWVQLRVWTLLEALNHVSYKKIKKRRLIFFTNCTCSRNLIIFTYILRILI